MRIKVILIVMGVLIVGVVWGVNAVTIDSENIENWNKVDAGNEDIGNEDTGNEDTGNEDVEEQEKLEDSEEQLLLEEVTVIIDPGHGGSDPGKVGINQALEKDINLQIGWKVYDSLTTLGYGVLMTREDDNGMDESGEMSKVEDLEARVTLINDTTPELVVSIHQNSYSSESVSGAQVFYYTNSSEGEVAAQLLQEALLEVDSDNTRQIKDNDTYYLLKRTQVPTVIVECGFLSNASEADKLIEDSYQQEIAEAIVRGIVAYLEN